MNTKLFFLSLFSTAAALAIAPYPVAGQEYPAKQISIVIAYGAGSCHDGLMRQMPKEMSAKWKQPVLVENRPGANGAVA